MKILVIDDESPVRRMITKMLRHDGWQILEAADGPSGLREARIHLPDVILCDFDMAGMNGFQTLAQLRSTDATATIPFILITGATDRAGLRQSMNLGADDYLAKPFDQAQLLNCVLARVTRARHSREQAAQKLAQLRASILAALPHALKTPLNGILGYSELLAFDYDAFSREEIREMTGTIRESATALNQLVDRFLGYTELALRKADPTQTSTIHTGRAMATTLDLPGIARKATERHGRHADLVLRLGDGRAAISPADLVRLAEELLDNACKFSSANSKIELVSEVRNGRFIIEVRDAGRGLTTAQIAAAGALMQFDRRRYEQQGCGLGLAIAHLIADLNGGSLKLQSEPGHGTVAIVELNVAG